ncbi:ECs_2282 family putative zinc-binding protein [Aeromonas caviae]|uniref:ECs_2282 family putative zinc-binding protein n=1 Tax=Aeromonas caviae TaxID=648 RepID=UPI0038D163C8
MKLDKLNREIRMYCPTCGNTEFSFVEHDEEGLVICTQCEREMAKSELLEENSELLAEAKNEITKEAHKQIELEIKKRLRNAFKGNKNLKFK